MASVYPSTQWSRLRRAALPGFAASDIAQGAPVCVASAGDEAFIMCTTAQQKPVGVAADWAIAGNPLTVYDYGNTYRTSVGGNGAGASFARQSYIGVIGTSQVAHPQSGVVITTPLLGQVLPTGSPVGGGTAASSIWAVGVARESAAVGDFAEYRIEPAVLSGIVNP